MMPPAPLPPAVHGDASAAPRAALPAPPLAEALPDFDDPLRRRYADPGLDAPFATAGRRAVVTGRAGRGVDEIRIHPMRVLHGLRYEAAVPRGATVTPVGVERRIEVGGADVAERIFVPRNLPAAILEWRAAADAELALSWTTDLRTKTTDVAGPPQWTRDGRRLRVHMGADRAAAFVLSAEPAMWEVEEAAGEASLRVRLRMRVDGGGSVRLAVAGTIRGEDDLAATLASLRADALVRARAAALRRARRERLAVDAPDPRIAEAVEWAKAWLEGSGGAGSPPVQSALAALVLGDFDVAREMVRELGARLERSRRAPAPAPAGGDGPDHAGAHGTGDFDAPDLVPYYLLLVARYLAWTGDLAFVRDEWPRVKFAGAVMFEGAGDAAPRDAELHDAVLREVAVAAESIGDGALAEMLRERERRAPRAGTRALAAVAPAAGAAGPDLYPASNPVADVHALVHGLLGAEPDAVKHRLRLRPRLPAEWDRLEVRRLRMGDALISLSYRCDGDRHGFRIGQESGAVPVTLVFEPLLAAPRLVAARVDGQPAELDPRPHGDRMLVPVQIVLDAERVVELDVAHEPLPRAAGLRVWRT